jgi:hypothetical protein
MPFKLKVSKPAPPSWYHEYEFDKDSVTIGREARCDLQLEGINSVVSREHKISIATFPRKQRAVCFNGLQ